MALAVKGGSLGKGGEPGTPRGVSDKGDGVSRKPDKTSERLSTKGVSGAFLATNSLGATRSDEQLLLVGCLATVRPVAEARPVGGSGLRETASKREESEEESLVILRNVRQVVESWNQQR